ncbi:MAG: acetate--CoA ligase family protein [Acetobacterales bacterium]
MAENSVIAAAREAGRGSLDERAGKALLASRGIAVPRSVVVKDASGARGGALEGLSFPVVVKVMSAEILHKSDAGGVKVGLADAAAVADAVAAMAEQPKIRAAKVDGYLVEEMAPKGQEVVIGGLRDPRFGAMVMVGLGGIFVELLADVAFRICPIGEADAREMLDELKAAPLLRGARGGAAVSEDAIVDALLKVGGEGGLLVELVDEIRELDINPLIVSADGAVAADARVILTGADDAAFGTAKPERLGAKAKDFFRPLFEPKTVGVIGASGTGVTIANTFIQRMADYGFPGEIYPIHPKADELEGLKAYPSLAETPKPVDYAYIAIGAERIPDILGAADGRVSFAQVISSGFGEVESGRALEATLKESAKAGGCRVLGPNCLGTYSPRGRLTFPPRPPEEVGPVGVITQSGGLGTDIIRRGSMRGLRFSGLVTVGNSVDLGPNDLLEFYLADEKTRVIGMYLEDVKDGRRFLDILKDATKVKPVVLLKGGRTAQGQLAAASHTGSLAGDERVWVALEKQTGAVMVDTLDEFIELLLAFQTLTPRPERPTERCVLFGNGGGTSVLATDFFARCGLDVSPLDKDTLAELEALGLPPGTSVVNPIDTPVATLQREEGKVAEKILDIVYGRGRPDALVMHLNLAAFVGRGPIDPLDNLMAAAVRVQERFPGQAHFMLVLRSDGEPKIEESKRAYRERAMAANIPVYDELSNVAMALRAFRGYERFRARRG